MVDSTENSLDNKALHRYIREVLLKDFADTRDILPVEVKNQIKNSSGKIRGALTNVMSNLERENFTDTESIDKAIAMLNTWKTCVEKILN